MAADLFDLLADNAWTLPTADGSANLHVTELGSGPPIVTLHGGPGAHFAYLVDARAGHNAWIDDPHAFDRALAAALAHQPSS